MLGIEPIEKQYAGVRNRDLRSESFPTYRRASFANGQLSITALSEEKPYPAKATLQETNEQLEDCSAEVSEVMEETNEVPTAGISSASCSQHKADGESTSDEIEEEDAMSYSLSFAERETSTNKALMDTILEYTKSDSVVASSSQQHPPVTSASLEIKTEPDMVGINQKSHSSPDPNWLTKYKMFRSAAESRYSDTLAEGKPSSGHPLNKNQPIHKQYIDIIFDKWDEAETNKWLELKAIPLTPGGDTALHLAVSLNRTSIFYGLVDLMVPEELEIPNEAGNTAFCMCASSGNTAFACTMLNKNPGLVKIRGHNGMYPIQMAALGGHRHMLKILFENGGMQDLTFDQVVQLFFTTLRNRIYGVAYEMLHEYPRLAAARDEGQFTALHVLARKPPDESYRRQVKLDENPEDFTSLIQCLWTIIQFMEHNEMLDLIRRPSGVLFEAAESGNVTILDLFLRSNPELLMEVDSKRRNLFHIAVLYRQETVLIYMIKNGIFKDLVMQGVDEDLNNILHLAGMLPPHERFGSSRPDIQIQRELLWFKEVEKRVPTALKTMRNKDGKTPKDIFNNDHRELIDKGKKAVKNTANNGMLVATIVATIVFAASLTIPGNDVSPDASSSILQKKGWYIIFILSNAVALFSSSSSIIFLLSVLTSSFREDEFICSLQIRLMFGVTTLFVAITTMVVAFTAACFLIFNHQSTWVAYLVASLSFLTVALFILLLCALFGDLIRSLYWSRHLFRPPHYYQLIKSTIIVFIRLMEGLAFKIRYKLGKMHQNAEARKRRLEDNPIVDLDP